MKLKTLNDLDNGWIEVDGVKRILINGNELKQELINWIKELRKEKTFCLNCIKDYHSNCKCKSTEEILICENSIEGSENFILQAFIQKFGNITEEDL